MPQKLSEKLQQGQAPQDAPVALSEKLVSRIVHLPRVIRVLIVGIFALAVTLAVSPLVDLIYDRYFFSMNTLMAPALVTAFLGLGMYLIGWWLIVGTVGETPPAHMRVLWYFSVGAGAVVIVTMLIILGIRLLNFVD